MKGSNDMSPAQSDPKAQRILTAVRKVLAGNGYSGTTINMVATEAGVSRGLLHYYFKSKDDMLAKVLKSNLEVSMALLAEIFHSSRNAKEIAEKITELLRGMMTTDRDFFHVFIEGFAVAQQSQLVNEQIACLYGDFRKTIHTQLKRAEMQGWITPTLPLAGLAVLIAAVIDGIALQLVTEPELAQDDEIWDAMTVGLTDLLTA